MYMYLYSCNLEVTPSLTTSLCKVFNLSEFPFSHTSNGDKDLFFRVLGRQTIWNVFMVHSRHFLTNVWMRESVSDKCLNTFGPGRGHL